MKELKIILAGFFAEQNQNMSDLQIIDWVVPSLKTHPECAMIDLKWSKDSGGYNKVVFINLPLNRQFNNHRAIFLTYVEDEEVIVNQKLFSWTPWEVIFHEEINKIRLSRGLEEADFPKYYSHVGGCRVK